MSIFKRAVFLVAVNLAGCASCPPTIADTALDAVLAENLPENVGSIAFDLQRELSQTPRHGRSPTFPEAIMPAEQKKLVVGRLLLAHVGSTPIGLARTALAIDIDDLAHL